MNIFQDRWASLQKRQPKKGIYNELQYFVDETMTLFNETDTKFFGMYIGVIKRIGLSRARAIRAEILEWNPDHPGKAFMWKCRHVDNIEKHKNQDAEIS